MNSLELQLRAAIAGVGDAHHHGSRVTVRIICTCGVQRAGEREVCPNCGSDDYTFAKATLGDVRAAEAQFGEATRALIYARAGFVPIVTES